MEGRHLSHYEIQAKLGEGGMGVVYRALDTKLDRTVALKFLPAHLLGDGEIRKRFEREAKASATLSHPNVCTVYEIDEAEGQTFIAMELIEGDSLDKRIEQGPLKLEEALEIARQIAEGLEAAHEKGIFHRDIKPENIMVDSKGRVTIMDFGLAQLTEASRLTKTDQTMGTVFYMSPEQTEGSGTDHRTDIWALGVVLYEMVTGQRPFKGDYDKAVMYSILNEEPEPITALRTAVPMQLEDYVGKCLEKSGANRYSSAAELATDLRTLAERLQSSGQASYRSRVQPSSESPARHAKSLSRFKERFAWAAAFTAAIVVAATQWQGSPVGPPDVATKRFTFAFDDIVRHPVISPNGRHIAYLRGTGSDVSLWV